MTLTGNGKRGQAPFVPPSDLETAGKSSLSPFSLDDA